MIPCPICGYDQCDKQECVAAILLLRNGRSIEAVNHPTHYGGAEDPFEHQKVVTAWGLDYFLGNCTKYICRAGKKPGNDVVQELEKAMWYLKRRIELEKAARK